MKRVPLLVIFVLIIFFHSNLFASNVDISLTVLGSPHCNDSIDNDSDTFIDYPDDPGCDSTTDENEIDPPTPPPSPPPPPPSSGGGGGGSSATYSNSVIFRGIAYPGSKVTVLKDGKLAASVNAGPDAKFEIRLSDLAQGTYVFGTWAEDKVGRRSAIYTFTVAVTNGITTTVSGIFVSPTIALDKSEVKRGDILNIFGQGTPNSDVNVIINSETELVKKTKTDTLGSWLYKFNSVEVESGDHVARSRVIYQDDISPDSTSVSFKVGTRNVVVSIPNPSLATQDINSDNKVNLADFSILAYWYKRPNPEVRVDLNNDGVVNLVDFSILAYYWTG